jgi:cell wall-associated NlpC family hydrolase
MSGLAKFNEYIRKYQPNSPLTADVFRDAWNQDPDLARGLLVLGHKESSLGTTNGRFRNNAWGYGVKLGANVHSAPDWRTMAGRVARGLSGDLYKGAGLRTLRQVLPKYAPSFENNTALYDRQNAQRLRELGGDVNADMFDGVDSATGTRGSVTEASAARTAELPGQDAPKPVSLRESIAGQLLSRPKGQSITQTVVQAALGSALAPAVPLNEGLARDAASAKQKADQLRTTGNNGSVIDAAKKWIGTPYSWGGGTTSGPSEGFAQGAGITGFDCSSLVQHAWAKAGVKLPRVTYDQIKVGRGINSKNMGAWQPGDLMFPSTGHVQMYIGNGKVIEAPRTGGHVQIVNARGNYMAVRRPRG